MWIARGANEQYQTAACRPWPHGSSKDSTSGDGGAQKFSLKEFCYQVGHRHRAPAQQPVHVFLAELAQSASGLEHGPEIAAAGIVNVRRRKLQGIGNNVPNLFQRLLE